jgi:NADPH:quinone reductase
MPKAMICRELGAPEVLRLETFESKPLAGKQVRVRVRADGRGRLSAQAAIAVHSGT